MVGVEAGQEAAVLEGAQLWRGLVSSGDHLKEAVAQGCVVLMSPLVLQETHELNSRTCTYTNAHTHTHIHTHIHTQSSAWNNSKQPLCNIT